ncbi:amidase domain-containing protein, partial [Streptomyces sp. NPDC005728]|uniref:amidase domain-containing protein n=1 Tax=Streptomyces sp. NPDC005728 TaxID=3157054 RepID=UPI0033E29CAE
MKSRNLSRKRSRATIVTAAAASVAVGTALLPGWTAGAAVTNYPTVDPTTKATFQRLADAVFTDRTQALVDDPKSGEKERHQQRTSVFSGNVRLSASQSLAERSALTELRGRQSRLARLGEKYSDGNTRVTLDATRVTGRTAKTDVTETTTLTYAKATGNEPKTTGFQAHHELTFKADRQGTWQLTNVKDTDNGYIAVNQVAKQLTVAVTADTADDSPPEAPRATTSWPAPANRKTLTGGTYDYKAMVAYATKYWKNYNTSYPDYNGQGAGGDCTNFVSQSLKAGGWKHVPGYTYDFHKWFGNA